MSVDLTILKLFEATELTAQKWNQPVFGLVAAQQPALSFVRAMEKVHQPVRDFAQAMRPIIDSAQGFANIGQKMQKMFDVSVEIRGLERIAQMIAERPAIQLPTMPTRRALNFNVQPDDVLPSDEPVPRFITLNMDQQEFAHGEPEVVVSWFKAAIGRCLTTPIGCDCHLASIEAQKQEVHVSKMDRDTLRLMCGDCQRVVFCGVPPGFREVSQGLRVLPALDESEDE